MTSKFKKGDKVVVRSSRVKGFWYDDKIGEVFTLLNPSEAATTDWCVEEYPDRLIEAGDIELYQDVSPKSLLKDWNRVKLRSGTMCIVSNGELLSIRDGRTEWESSVNQYNEDGFDCDESNWDIMQIYSLPLIRPINYFNPECVGSLLWERESPEEESKRRQREQLEQSVVKMEQQLKEMKQNIANLK